MHKIFIRRKTILNSSIAFVIVCLWVIFLFSKFLAADSLAGTHLSLPSRILFVIQGSINLFQAELPILLISTLILFRLPNQQELYLLVTKRKLKKFILYNVFRTNLLFIIAITIACICFIINQGTTQLDINLQNLSKSLLLGITFILGINIYGILTNLIAIKFSKIIAFLVMLVIVTFDSWLFNTFNISFFIHHGLTSVADFSSAIFNLLLYILYTIILVNNTRDVL